VGCIGNAATQLWLDTPPLQAAAFSADPALDPAASREGGRHGDASAGSARAAEPPPAEPGRSAPPGAAQDAAAGSAPPPAGVGEGNVAGLGQDPARPQGVEDPPDPAEDPLLARIAAGLLRVEAALPREALAADWPAQAWRQVRRVRTPVGKQAGKALHVWRSACCMTTHRWSAARRQLRAHAWQPGRPPPGLPSAAPHDCTAAELQTPRSRGPCGRGCQTLDGGAQAVREAQCARGLRAALAQLEAAVQAGFISPLFARCPALVAGAWPSAGALPQSRRMPPPLPRCLPSLCVVPAASCLP